MIILKKKIVTRNYLKLGFFGVIFLLYFTLNQSIIWAASSGPNNPSTGSNVTGIGTIAWSNSGYIASDDLQTAQVSFANINEVSNYLRASNFGFAIPSGATINGIVVSIKKNGSASMISDEVVSMVKADSTIGNTNKKIAGYWASIAAYSDYGSSIDTWDESWSAEDINDTDFGVVIVAKRTNSGMPGTKYGDIDNIKITVYYTEATPSGFSCSITTSAGCTGTVLLRMSGSTNAHAELPSQSTSNYDNNVVCCTGIVGLSNSCAASNHAIFARLSGVTNAHVEKNTESGVNYTQNACMSSSFAGDEINIGYQPANCTGYDTTLFSMSSSTTNSQIGIPSAYTNKVCASIDSQSISFNISDNAVGFGNLTPSGLRYATGDGNGSSSETESYNITVSTNAPSGYGLYVSGDPLKNGAITIDAIGGTNITPSAGSKSFGLRAVATGGSGSVVSPYNGSGFAYDADSSNATTIASSSSGDGEVTTYSIRTVATIDSLLDPGNYSTDLVYVVTANF